MPRLTMQRGVVAASFGAWGLSVAVGTYLMGAYTAAPGDPGTPTVRWPGGSALRLDGRRPTLLIFLHPRCPCSWASLDELAIVLDRCGDRASAQALVFRPRRDREDGFPSRFRAALANVPGLAVVHDLGGAEARRFGVATSGHVLLFDPRGALIFSGGITPGRGERGDGPGRAALLGRIMSTTGGGPELPVFGCSLRTPRRALDPGRSE